MTRRYGRSFRASKCAAAGLLLGSVFVLGVSVPAGASTVTDIRGTWNTDEQCYIPPTGCSADANGTLNITTEDLSSGSFSGTETGNGATDAVAGTITGNSIQMTLTPSGTGSVEVRNGTINGSTAMSGIWIDAGGHLGGWTATKPK
jgi:hypothetical protein